MLPLSVAILAHNEADRIGEALASVSFADEVVVLDSGSSDDTVAVARAAGARVIETDWPGFVAQKNRALEAVSHRWVLSLDADERVSQALADEIASLWSGGEPQGVAGYSVPRLSWWMGAPLRYGTWYPDRRVRLVDRHHARWEGDDPHDRLGVSGRVACLQGDLLHHPYRSFAEHAETIDRYTRIAAQAARERGVVARAWDPALRPAAHLFKALVLKRGLLDGPRGLAVAGLGAVYVQLKWLRIAMGDPPGEPG